MRAARRRRNASSLRRRIEAWPSRRRPRGRRAAAPPRRKTRGVHRHRGARAAQDGGVEAANGGEARRRPPEIGRTPVHDSVEQLSALRARSPRHRRRRRRRPARAASTGANDDAPPSEGRPRRLAAPIPRLVGAVAPRGRLRSSSCLKRPRAAADPRVDAATSLEREAATAAARRARARAPASSAQCRLARAAPPGDAGHARGGTAVARARAPAIRMEASRGRRGDGRESRRDATLTIDFARARAAGASVGPRRRVRDARRQLDGERLPTRSRIAAVAPRSRVAAGAAPRRRRRSRSPSPPPQRRGARLPCGNARRDAARAARSPRRRRRRRTDRRLARDVRARRGAPRRASGSRRFGSRGEKGGGAPRGLANADSAPERAGAPAAARAARTHAGGASRSRARDATARGAARPSAPRPTARSRAGGSKPPSGGAMDAAPPSVPARDVRGLLADAWRGAVQGERHAREAAGVAASAAHSAAPPPSTAAPSTPPRTPRVGGQRRLHRAHAAAARITAPSRRGATGSSPEPKSPPWAPGATEAAAARVRSTTADFGVLTLRC